MRFVHHVTAAIVLAASLSAPAFAQGTSPSNSPGATGSTGTSVETTTLRNDDRGFDWGWLGLIGLAGLMGLRKQPEVHRTDTPRTATPR